MLSQKERELLIKTYEETKDADMTAKIFGVNRSTVYARIKEYRETNSTDLHTSQRGRKKKIAPDDEERIKKLIEENNDITIREINEALELGVSDETVRRRVIKLGYRYKKKSVYAAERDRSRCGSEKK